MLRALAQYKYLSISHIVQLGVSKSKDTCRKYFAALQKRKFTGSQRHYSVSPRYAEDKEYVRKHYENLHYLTRTGVQFLRRHTDAGQSHIHFPKTPNNYLSNDYLHRISTISSHISFNTWVAQQG